MVIMLSIPVNIVKQSCLLLFSQIFPQVLSKKLTNHQKNHHFDLTGANLSYSKQVKAVSGRLLVNPEKIGIIDHKILSYSPTVKGTNAFGNSPYFQIQIED
jgi:hypothetical protein